MREGSLEAPTRHKIDWQNPDFYDRAKIDAEMHRIFDICHGCRRCFNLCDSFPRLFDLVDSSATGEVDAVDTGDYGKVVEACTLCDMCFMTKCPYVPPHPWAVDFPHLMLRYRAADFREGKLAWPQRQLVETDRNGRLAGAVAPLANWASRTGNALTRPVMEKLADIDRRAELPKFHGRSFTQRAKSAAPVRDAATLSRDAVERERRLTAEHQVVVQRLIGEREHAQRMYDELNAEVGFGLSLIGPHGSLPDGLQRALLAISARPGLSRALYGACSRVFVGARAIGRTIRRRPRQPR